MLTRQISKIISFMAIFHKSSGFVVGFFFFIFLFLPHLSKHSGYLPISAPFDLLGSDLQAEHQEILFSNIPEKNQNHGNMTPFLLRL